MKMLFIIGFSIFTAGILFSADSFTDNGNGTVKDNKTGLIWQKCSAGLSGSGCSSGKAAKMRWNKAVTYCKSLSLGTKNDWRLPDVKELVSIVKYEKSKPAIDSSYFPDTQPTPYWSSNAQVDSDPHAWFVDFVDGSVGSPVKQYGHSVRCVSGP